MLRLNYFLIVLLDLEFKEVVLINNWCTHSFLNHSKQTLNEKDMGFQTRNGLKTFLQNI
jgi:hypothetical protein